MNSKNHYITQSLIFKPQTMSKLASQSWEAQNKKMKQRNGRKELPSGYFCFKGCPRQTPSKKHSVVFYNLQNDAQSFFPKMTIC